MEPDAWDTLLALGCAAVAALVIGLTLAWVMSDHGCITDMECEQMHGGNE